MGVTKKTYPDWVQKFRTKGRTIKKKGNRYYLYKRTSVRVPGKKYPQPVDSYIGVITPEGIHYAESKVVPKTSRLQVREAGYTRALLEKCPEDWKIQAGEQWEVILKMLILQHSANSYLRDDGNIQREDVPPCDPAALYTLLEAAMKERCGVDHNDLELLKYVYVLKDLDSGEISISVTDVAQQALLDRLSLDVDGIQGGL